MIAPHVSRPSLAVYLAGLLALAIFTVASVKVNLFVGTREYRVVGTYWASGDAANHHRNPYAVVTFLSSLRRLQTTAKF